MHRYARVTGDLAEALARFKAAGIRVLDYRRAGKEWIVKTMAPIASPQMAPASSTSPAAPSQPAGLTRTDVAARLPVLTP